MKKPGKLQVTAYSLGFLGAALFTGLLVRQGVKSVGAAVATAGWGIAAVAAFHLMPILLDALAWRVLFPPADRPRWQSLFWMRWIGESISNLVPSATVGGDIVRARLVAINGVSLATAAATIIVDITLGIVTQIVFTLLGLALVINVTGRTSFVGPTLVGTLIGVAAVAGFYFAQRRGMFRFVSVIITRLVNSPEWTSLVEGGATLDQTVRALYGRRRGVLACCAWTMISLLASSGDFWIALRALGLPASLVNALILHRMP